MGTPSKALLTQGSMARGCDLCFPGLKAVIFITGLCDDSCFYCPVSRDKLGHDVFYINEERVHGIGDLIVEIERMGASGASITGGDPLIAYDRVVRVVRALKEAFGPGFHIHLYTSGRYATIEALIGLWRAGLDEIRFHPTLPGFTSRIKLAKRYTGMSVGVEMPLAPGMEEWAKRVITEADAYGADFININEMEIVEPNSAQLLARGYRESKRRPFTVEGSYEAILSILEWAAHNVKVPVHFCPASFKDSIQTKNRFRRLAMLDRRWYEEPTPQGTIRWGELRGYQKEPPEGLGEKCNGHTLCTPPVEELLSTMAGRYGGTPFIVEAHPTRNRKPIISETMITSA